MHAARMAGAMVVAMSVLLAGCQTTTGSIDTSGRTIEPDRTTALIKSGKKNFAAANYGLSEKEFRQAVEASPLNGEAWLGLAASYDQLGRFDLSDRAYEQLLKIAGPKPAVLNNQGYSYILRGEKKKAQDFLKQARAAMPANKTVENNWSLLKKM